MNPQAPPHQRIRFRRSDIIDLNSLPSAGTEPTVRASSRRRLFRAGVRSGSRHALLRWAGAAAGIAATPVLLLALGIYAIGATGIGTEKLRQAAERAVERAAGREMATAIGATRLSLDGSRLIGLEVSDVGLQAVGQPRSLASAASLRFGIELLPLLSGRLVLSSASLSNATIDAGALGTARGGDWLGSLRRPDGLIDPDRLPPVLFGALQQAFMALERDFSGRLELSDVRIVLPAGDAAHRLTVTAAEAVSSDPSALSLSAEGTFDGRAWSLSGVAERDMASGRITLLDLDVSARGSSETAAAEGGTSLGSLQAELTGEQGEGGAPSRLRLAAGTEGSSFDLMNNRGILSGTAALALGLEEGAGSVRIERLHLSDERNGLDFSGELRPQAAEAGGEPSYAFKLDGPEVKLAAAGLDEPPFTGTASLEGSFAPATRRLRLDRIAVGSGEARVSGSFGLQPAEGMSSGVDAAFSFSALPVRQAKQLWPWFAARSARGWVQNHLAGGTLEEGRIDYHVPPGRITSGQPPTPEELRGRFTVTATQFDTAGQIPPVAQADGIVSLAGTDIDVAVSTGVATLPSGRTLRTRGGSLALRAFHRAPLIGRLDLDLAGDAAAAAELAGLEPINAMRQVPFGADDLSGTVTGHVSADVPFARNVPRDSLDFTVSLEFKKLGIAKPLEGQTVSDADGTLTVDPQKALIQASAKLNGAQAKLDFAEPLRPSVVRSRRIELALDDKARNAIAPGLSTLLSGSATLRIDASEPARKVRADLSKAKLSAPWVSWSKGAGIPATASFVLAQADGRTTISELEVSGGTFRLAGSAALDRNGLVSAQLPSVQLNRGDQLAVTVRRADKGYDVSVRGASYDGRALVKGATARSEGEDGAAGGNASSGSGRAASVTLKAEIGSITGFGNETLKGVNVAFRSSGGQNRSLRLSGATDAGGAVSLSDETKGGTRRMALETADAGSVLRFANIYGNMRGGRIEVALAGPADGLMSGKLDARNFSLIDEPRLGSLVSARGGGSRSLQDAVQKSIDTNRAVFDRASADISKGRNTLAITNGILRGTSIGSTFQGTVYDAKGRMDMTGTFMPAYGLNRLFGELPLIGLILGNGNDRGLIGVTFKLEGDAKSPNVTVNPLSVIAPGIFRQIFEFQ